ncbi:MAG: hypothetical protein HWD85_01190 [Flavobacteriaceae bacterium]|nr:hypothetical protein [Flavobacteriaceae bacterium]
MRHTIKEAGLIMTLLLLIGTFASCKKTVKKEVIADNTIITEVKETPKAIREPLVFIAGVDSGDNDFYASARQYFIENEYEVVDDAFSLEEIINWLNRNYDERLYGEIHIVSHSNPWKGMSLETVIKGERVTVQSLKKNAIEGKVPVLKDVIAADAKIVFHACGLGENKKLLQVFKTIFTTSNTPKIVASPYYTIFSKDTSKHYLAKPYYGYYPTANSPGKVDLAKEFAKSYPEEKDIDWYNALNNEEERYVGEAYTHQFNIPVEWEIDYSDSDETIPTFKWQEEIMDWISENEELAKEFSNYNIPLEKFRWKAYKKGSKLIIKGKTTVLCVLKPLIKPYGDLQHIEPEIDNLRLYNVE